MTVSKLDPAEVEALWERHAADLRRMVLGVLRDAELADEALQQTFVTVLERGHTADPETRRGWVFRVAFNTAIALKRRDSAGRKAFAHLQDAVRAAPTGSPSAVDTAIDSESRQRTRDAVGRLPTAQQQVVEMRMHDGKTFQQIADELGIPLSTALTRMRLALQKLRDSLD